MKTWKQFTVMVIVAIITLAFVFTACSENNEKIHAHDWGNWTETTPPTITADGEETRICTTCGEKETRTGTDAFAKPFFGTWVDSNGTPYTVIINANLIVWEVVEIAFDNTFGKYNISEWTETDNEDNDTKDDYPFGYSLDFKIIDHSLSGAIGSAGAMLIFINEMQNKLLFADNIFDKME